MQLGIVTKRSIREDYVMSERVSQSKTGQNEPKPTREERDEAYSMEGGRKAEEVEVREDGRTEDQPAGAPIGTELETRAEEI